MATNFEYAQLSGRAYDALLPANRTPVPLGWEEIISPISTFYGFSGGAYFKASTNEVVISYTGTNENADWIFANPQLTAGVMSPHISAAVALYQDIKAMPQFAGGTVKYSFTGHSLGAGLASLMAMFFDKPAFVFDPAPFKNSTYSASIRVSIAMQ